MGLMLEGEPETQKESNLIHLLLLPNPTHLSAPYFAPRCYSVLKIYYMKPSNYYRGLNSHIINTNFH